MAAVWLGLGLSFAAQNCNSLNVVSSIKNQELKISSIVGYKSDIILLSDVRLNGRDRTISDRFKLNYKMYHNSTMNRRGVAVLFSNHLDLTVMETAADPHENILLMKVKINNQELIVGSIYGPNDNNCDHFFNFITETCMRWGNIPKLIGGDWNATLSCENVNENIDVLFMRDIPSRYRSERVADLCENLDMSDPFRTLHPDSREFTYLPSGVLRNNRSRIDYFLVSQEFYSCIKSCSIAQGFCRKSFDHKPIFLTTKKKQGKGRACVHDCTLNNPHLDHIRSKV